MDVVAGTKRPLEQLTGFTHRGGDIDGAYLAVGPARVGITPGKVEHAPGQCCRPSRRVVDQRSIALNPGRVVHMLLDQSNAGGDCLHRVVEIMRHTGRHMAERVDPFGMAQRRFSLGTRPLGLDPPLNLEALTLCRYLCPPRQPKQQCRCCGSAQPWRKQLPKPGGLRHGCAQAIGNKDGVLANLPKRDQSLFAAVEALGCPKETAPAQRLPGGVNQRVVRIGSPWRLLRHWRIAGEDSAIVTREGYRVVWALDDRSIEVGEVA